MSSENPNEWYSWEKMTLDREHYKKTIQPEVDKLLRTESTEEQIAHDLRRTELFHRLCRAQQQYEHAEKLYYEHLAKEK